ncbi:MAG: hypothetical protein GF383_16515 [Candidatus Lokiarchaeota archaeon]|nr:hypothetical protein [Candidatus Lokiarchaeota archaeon]
MVNIGRKKHPNIFSHRQIAYNLGLNSDIAQPLSTSIKKRIIKFLISPPIKFFPSNGHPTKKLKFKSNIGISKIKPQRYQMSPSKFVAMTQTACVVKNK